MILNMSQFNDKDSFFKLCPPTLKKYKSKTNYKSTYKLCFLISLLIIIFNATAQIRSPKSYALVIGVSQYEDPKITPLKHAHKDAGAFADFCASPSGLNIPVLQLKVLTNEKASYWNIVDGLDWLKSSAQKDDQVYIYFAGHGDMESKELKYGYLLAHDSRFMNYLGRSLSLDLLNKTAHTLTVNKKAKVFLITDACHSGKLAGVDFNGSNLVAQNLMQLVSNNEVRITSCNEGELSYEDEVWGDGRGAFSYFLTRGMSGEADGVGGKKDGNITIGEIKTYLNGKVPDNVRTIKKAKQNPVVIGTETVVLNEFKPTSNTQILALTSSSDGIKRESGSRSVTTQEERVFEEDILKSINSKIETDFALLSKNSNKEIIHQLLENLRIEDKYTKKTLSSSQSSLLVAKTLYNKVQQVIDLYLSGDEAELEKRRYYSQVDKPYDQYPYMLDIAIKLLPKDHSMIPTLQMQKEYLTGLSYRLKMTFSKDYMGMLDSSFIYQKKALALDTSAAYIHNELGIIYLFKKNYVLAKHHFEKAKTIAPLWSLPYANLANFYLITKDDTLAKKYVDIAFDRQINLQSPYVVDGSIFMNADNLLFAEEQFQKAIKINSRHFIPFEKLGELYLKTQNYEQSNEYYYESELRKLGLLYIPTQVPEFMVDAPFFNLPPCYIDSTKADPNDIMATFAVGKYFFDIDSLNLAHRWFEKTSKLDVENPLVYHYLGQTAHFFKHYEKAEFYFKRAIALHLPDSLFTLHVQEMANLSTSNGLDFTCLLKTYEKAKFDFYTPNIYLARNYEKWGNFISASEQYNTCIDIDKENNLAYYMLWNLYKKRNQIELAENTIYRFGQYFPKALDHTLADFYGWVLDKYKEDLQKTELYSYKYGLLMHHFMTKSPDSDWDESLMPTPDEEDKDYTESFESKLIFSNHNTKDQLKEDVIYNTTVYIDKPLSTGVIMLKKVVSISIDNDVKADAYAKMGDFYIRAKSDIKALECYENSLNIKEDDIGIRSRAITSADRLYLFKKAFNHLWTLKETNGLGFDDAILLAEYYMKSGDRDQAIILSDKISNTHPDLKDEIEEDVIKLYLRFGEYQKALDLLNIYLENWETDMIIEYMLARAYAGLNKGDEALKHIQNAESLGFNYGFVYKNDKIFEPFRSSGPSWLNIQARMEEFISLKMAGK
jgi:tetratricopeptide (TPR) repeat protein